MRIDYFIVSEKLATRIISCEMHGKGIELEGTGLFNAIDCRTFLSFYFSHLELETLKYVSAYMIVNA